MKSSSFKMRGFPPHAGTSPIKKDSQNIDLSISDEVIAANLEEKENYDRIVSRRVKSERIKEGVKRVMSSDIAAKISGAAAGALVSKVLSKKKKKVVPIVPPDWKINV